MTAANDPFHIPANFIVGENLRPAEVVDALQKEILRGISHLPQWPVIRALGNHPKWARGLAWRMVDESLPNARPDGERDVERDGARGMNPVHVAMAASKASWHIRRLSGLGGSEVGVFVTAARGLDPEFQTPRDVIAGKLCLRLPERSNMHMTRGNRAEPVIRDIFFSQMGFARDEAAMKAVTGYRNPKVPWMIGNPDELCRAGSGGPLILADYKAPSPDTMKNIQAEGAPLEYVAQLHHYALIATGAGYPPKRMVLAPFNLLTFAVEPIEVPIDKAFMRELFDLSQAAWRDNVMKGELPALKAAANIEKDDLHDIAARLAVIDAMGKALDKFRADLVEGLESELYASRRFGALDYGPYTLKSERKFDEEELHQVGLAFGAEPASFRKADPKKVDKDACVTIVQRVSDMLKLADANDADLPGTGTLAREQLVQFLREATAGGLPHVTKLDAPALAAAIEKAGGDVSATFRAGLSFAMSRKKDHSATIGGFRADVAEVVEEAANYSVEAVGRRWPALAGPTVREDAGAAPDAA